MRVHTHFIPKPGFSNSNNHRVATGALSRHSMTARGGGSNEWFFYVQLGLHEWKKRNPPIAARSHASGALDGKHASSPFQPLLFRFKSSHHPVGFGWAQNENRSNHMLASQKRMFWFLMVSLSEENDIIWFCWFSEIIWHQQIVLFFFTAVYGGESDGWTQSWVIIGSLDSSCFFHFKKPAWQVQYTKASAITTGSPFSGRSQEGMPPACYLFVLLPGLICIWWIRMEPQPLFLSAEMIWFGWWWLIL